MDQGESSYFYGTLFSPRMRIRQGNSHDCTLLAPDLSQLLEAWPWVEQGWESGIQQEPGPGAVVGL